MNLNIFENKTFVNLLKLTFIIYSLIIMYLAFMPIEHIGANSDKVNHLLAFIVYVGLISQSFKINHKIIILYSLLFAVFIEFVQYFLSYRSAEFLDILADMVGAFLGLLLVFSIYRFKVKE